jgi:hypothetical protein
MTIFDSHTRPVKSARIFALGLSRPGPFDRLPVGPTAADRAWAARVLNASARDYDVVSPDFDRLAAESACVDLMSRGLPPF